MYVAEAIIACGGESRSRDRSRRKLRPIHIRKSQYLNNGIVQDQRRIRSLLGFGSWELRRYDPFRHRDRADDAQMAGEVGL
ncbi:transposase [Aquamicrobium defluvii]|uniref:Transposase n=1 Tax=Aquamicrobium defluvii TaxID=69279 RepID=A0A011TI10_9HYPH|nr:transposase [Aquamicrobium defluvii]EZQ15267.1 transposase [Halopseudomonas bauzanensis]